MKFLSNLFASMGNLAASFGSQACILVIIDEPECPKSLIKWINYLIFIKMRFYYEKICKKK